MRGAADVLIRTINGDDAHGKLGGAQLDRILGNAGTLFGIDSRDLATLNVEVTEPTVPLVIAHGTDSPAFLSAGARALANTLHKDLVSLPGTHVPQTTHPSVATPNVVAAAGMWLVSAALW
jgi:hypothetical protein